MLDPLHGTWQREYVTAGALYMKSTLRFEESGVVTLDATSMPSFSEPRLVEHYPGSFSRTERGTVAYGWQGEGFRAARSCSLRSSGVNSNCCPSGSRASRRMRPSRASGR